MITLCSVAQSDCDPMDCSPPGSSVLGIFQAGILEWAAISSFRGSSWSTSHTLPGGFFTASATCEAQLYDYYMKKVCKWVFFLKGTIKKTLDKPSDS